MENCKFFANKMKTMRKAARLTDEEDKGKELLDAELWGQLQEHIPLQCIYEKLLQQDLLQLRLVSKEWNLTALQWILPKVSFVTVATGVDKSDIRFLNGIVTYDIVSGKFQFNRQRLPLYLLYDGSHVPPFEVEGLILCHSPDHKEERGVFNVHNQTWHSIAAGPEQSAGPDQSDETMTACGLLVDTTVKPYTFKLIEGNMNFNTQIYDSKSRSWSKTSSRLPSSFMAAVSIRDTYEYSCICSNGDVYISDGSDLIQKYSLEDDKWTVLNFPEVRICKYSPETDNILGVWEGRIFTTRENYKKRRVSVWELVDSTGQEWVEYARMPKELYKWLWKCDYGFLGVGETMDSRAFFRDGYVLVCSWRYDGARANLLALFDIATKIWRKVDLPRGTVAVDEQDSGSFHRVDVEGAEDSDEVDDEDEVDYAGEHVYVPEHFHENVDEDDDTDEDDVDEDDDLDEEDDADEDEEEDDVDEDDEVDE